MVITRSGYKRHSPLRVCRGLSFQIQPDMEELTDNAEEIAEEGDSTKDEKKLGRLQFKVRIT